MMPELEVKIHINSLIIIDDDYDKRYVDCLTHFMNSIFDIQKAQVFEYDFAHIVDKPFESLFGFIHVNETILIDNISIILLSYK